MEDIMSWFRHRPRAKEPIRAHPYRTSPLADKILKDTKEQVRKPSDLPTKTVNKD